MNHISFNPNADTNSALLPSLRNRVAFIQACWHRDMTDQCRTAFAAEWKRLGGDEHSVDYIEVPGSFEIPLRAKLLAKSGLYGAIVASGFVVDGGIYRHEFVANAVINALMQVQLETEVPVLSAVLTPQQFHEHEVHSQFFHAHMKTKGTEAAAACLHTLTAISGMRRSTTSCAFE